MTLPFSKQIIVECARASLAAYSPGPSDRVIEVMGGDVRLILRQTTVGTILAARGTANLHDWLIDLQCELVPVPHGKMHRGVSAAALALTMAIGVENLRIDFFTGHSLGGGLAVALDRSFGGTTAPCITFGQLRVGNAEYAAFCGLKAAFRHLRVVHAEDIVPHVPWLGYRHSGDLLLMDKDGGFDLNPSWLFQIESHAKGLWLDLQRIRTGKTPQWVLVSDHSMEKYLAGTEKLVD